MRNNLQLMTKYAFIFNNRQYEKVAFDDIMWINAERSYCEIMAVGDRKYVISLPMCHIEPFLPKEDFIRIHRSHIINLKYVELLIGNCLKIGNNEFTIGRKYRENVLNNFIFIGVRNNKKTP